jgi:hypothetical protein
MAWCLVKHKDKFNFLGKIKYSGNLPATIGFAVSTDVKLQHNKTENEDM